MIWHRASKCLWSESDLSRLHYQWCHKWTCACGSLNFGCHGPNTSHFNVFQSILFVVIWHLLGATSGDAAARLHGKRVWVKCWSADGGQVSRQEEMRSERNWTWKYVNFLKRRKTAQFGWAPERWRVHHRLGSVTGADKARRNFIVFSVVFCVKAMGCGASLRTVHPSDQMYPTVEIWFMVEKAININQYQ